jgi:hypothetical protein
VEKLHNEEPQSFNLSPNIIRVIKSKGMRGVKHVEHMGTRRGAYRVLVRKSKRKRALGRTRHRRKSNTVILYIIKWNNIL